MVRLFLLFRGDTTSALHSAAHAWRVFKMQLVAISQGTALRCPQRARPHLYPLPRERIFLATVSGIRLRHSLIQSRIFLKALGTFLPRGRVLRTSVAANKLI